MASLIDFLGLPHKVTIMGINLPTFELIVTLSLFLRMVSVGVSPFFLVVSIYFVQLDYILMFTVIMTGLWLGGAGPVMVFGLYSRFGNSVGAFGSLIFGSGLAAAGLFLQRNWAEAVYPWLESNGWHEPLGFALVASSRPFHPYIVWEMNAVKFPINSYELYFMAMFSGILAYVVGSFLTQRTPYNLDRLLHRGIYDVAQENKAPLKWSVRNAVSKLIGITPEYTRGDKVIAWSVFGYAIVYQFGLSFIGVLIWNLISPWPDEWWSTYFFITSLGVISTFSGSSSEASSTCARSSATSPPAPMTLSTTAGSRAMSPSWTKRNSKRGQATNRTTDTDFFARMVKLRDCNSGTSFQKSAKNCS